VLSDPAAVHALLALPDADAPKSRSHYAKLESVSAAAPFKALP
jgi:hypothetical protein